ncbi:MAG: hypothetical protein JWN10_1875, partial [Solirubrobacterales bacterium]|nr:hypothetical protein [Solirubrobacterales bacterium]
ALSLPGSVARERPAACRSNGSSCGLRDPTRAPQLRQ